MKKICSLLLVMVLLLAQGVKAAPLTQPDPGKTYMIQHSSMMFMTVSGSSIQINVAGEGDTQKVTFIPVEGQEGIYNILFDNGKYLGTDTGWTAKLMDDPSDHMTWFQFRQSYLEDWMLVYNIGHEEAAGGGNNCFGTDNNSAGGGVYTNKGGNDGKHLWNIVEATDGVILTGLETAIATAEGVLSSVTVGNEAGCYPQDAYDTLAAAVETAKGFLSSTSQAEVNAAGEALNAAVNEFYTKRFVFVPKAGQKYYFVNVSTDMMMGINGGGEAILDNPSGADTQKFEIEPVEGSNIAFNLKIADGSGYLARKGNWNTTTVADPTVNEAKIEFEIVDLANSVYTLKKLNAWGYMAADSDAPGSLVYTDKSNGHWTAKWQIREVVEGEMILIALERAIANAESYLTKAVVGENPGNYPQEAVNALAAALETAKAGLSAATQEEVNAATAALNAAINEFLAAKIDPFFVPRENTPYRFSVRKYESNYMTNNGDAVGTSAFESNNAAQHWYFQPVADAKYTYIVKNDGKVLNYDGTVTETADAEAPLWTVVYTATINNIDYFALVQYEDPTKVLTFGSGKNFAIQNLNTGEMAHQARLLRVDLANDPYLATLEQVIANARYTLANIDRGNEIGQWSDNKCNAFEAEIAAAEALAGATQEEVDAKAQELEAARVAFINNPNTVIKDEFDAAIAAALAKAEAAEIGTAVGQYYASAIEAFKAAIADFVTRGAAVSEQDECDALTAEVLEATENFVGNTEVQPVKDVLSDLVEKVCEPLYEAEKDNVGDDQGQRPQEVVDAFKAAIEKAKGLCASATATEADLQDMIEARESFLTGAVSVSRAALRTALAKAEGEEYENLVAGEFDGNYPQEAIDAFNSALAAAKEADTDMSMTQEEVDAAAKALNDAMNNLAKSVVSIKFAALDAAIELARTTIAGATVVGDGEGECPKAVVDAYQAVIDEAAGIDRAAINQADVDALVAKLGEAKDTFCTALVASTGINAVIAEAQETLDNAEQGFKPGNYPASAIESLREVMNSAITVAENAASTQAELLDAAAKLREAIKTFAGEVIPAHDLTDLIALIAEADEFIATTGSDDFALSIALEAAKAIVENPDAYTKSEVTKAQNDLRKALDYAISSGIDGVTAEGAAIVVAEGKVIVAGIAGEFTVAVYTVDGRLVVLTNAEATAEISLAAGKYVVAVQGEGVALSRVVLVK